MQRMWNQAQAPPAVRKLILICLPETRRADHLLAAMRLCSDASSVHFNYLRTNSLREMPLCTYTQANSSCSPTNPTKPANITCSLPVPECNILGAQQDPGLRPGMGAVSGVRRRATRTRLSPNFKFEVKAAKLQSFATANRIVGCKQTLKLSSVACAVRLHLELLPVN